MRRHYITIAIGVISLSLSTWMGAPVLAHCDGMDGPVVKSAKQALSKGEVSHALIWVGKADEPEVRQAFERTLAVRKLSAEAKELADQYFFETLVRVHRAGEGAAYTGLKPAGRDLGPAIPAADRALEDGAVAPLAKLLVDAVEGGLHRRFSEVIEAKAHATDGVEAGRRYVHAYVTFIHYVERLYEAAMTEPHGHFAEATVSNAGAGAAEQHHE